MADSSIGSLTEATLINNADLFVLEQSGTAKKLTGQTLKNYVYLDLNSVSVTVLPAGSNPTATYNPTTRALVLGIPEGDTISTVVKTGTSGLEDTYTITCASGHTGTFTVTNGSDIASVEKTATAGLVDTYTITLTNGNTHTFTVTNGSGAVNSVNGRTGDVTGLAEASNVYSKSEVDNAIANKAVRYDAAQSLTDAQKAQAQDNIGLDYISVVNGMLCAVYTE